MTTDDDKPKIPIDLGVKSGQGVGTHSSFGEESCPPVLAFYDAETLVISLTDYTGIAKVSISNKVTNAVVIQTIAHISPTDNSAYIDISGLPDGDYNINIGVTGNVEYEGEFIIH